MWVGLSKIWGEKSVGGKGSVGSIAGNVNVWRFHAFELHEKHQLGWKLENCREIHNLNSFSSVVIFSNINIQLISDNPSVIQIQTSYW